MTDSAYVPYLDPTDALQGGHAVLAVGYDDALELLEEDGATTSEGCLIFRNSWGGEWGDEGYGYRPYQCRDRLDLRTQESAWLSSR